MKKNKLIFIIIIVVFLFGLYIKCNNKNSKEIIDYEENMEIENESYYIKKQQEYEETINEYENILNECIEQKFSLEEKEKIEEYNQEMTKAINEGNKERHGQISKEKTSYIDEICQTRLEGTQKSNIKKMKNKINDLDQIVEEYYEKQDVIEKKKLWLGREKLSDGSIINTREEVISDKECEGLLFTNISLRYDAKDKKTYFGATVINNSQEIKEGMVYIKVGGDVETTLPLRLRKIEPTWSYDFEIFVEDDISMANTLEIIPYNEADYTEFTGNLIQQ